MNILEFEIEEVAEDVLAWNDPRWAQMGITYRKLDYWTRQGYVHAVGEARPGSGSSRRWSLEEMAVARRIEGLISLGFLLVAAAEYARDEAKLRRVAALILAVGEPA